MLENKITWSYNKNNQRRSGFMGKWYLLHPGAPWIIKALPKLMIPVLCLQLTIDSLYNRTYFWVDTETSERNEQILFHPLTTVREKIKPQQGCSLTLYLLDSASPEKEDNIPMEQPVNMIIYIYIYIDIGWRIRNIQRGKFWMALTGSARDITLQAAT